MRLPNFDRMQRFLPMNFWTSLPKPILALAPMEGITNSPFRRISKRFGADVVYTEFTAAEAIVHGGRKVLDQLRYAESERPIVCQIFGRDPESFRAAAVIVQRLGFDGLDINFGCPARKVVGRGAGVSLMRDPAYCGRLIEAVLDVVTIPLSIKVRASIHREQREIQSASDDRVTAADLVAAIKGLPVAAIMVHGRSYEGKFEGTVDLDMIRQVKSIFPGRVLANGGIRSVENARAMLHSTNADGVGIARGALGQPWIFAVLRQALRDGPESADQAWSAHTQDILDHAAWLAELPKRGNPVLEFRKHLAWYVRGTTGATAVRRSLASVHSLDDVRRVVATALAGVRDETPPGTSPAV